MRERALAVFRRLAEAEAEVHGSTPEKVHFHEVGAVDALVDVVGAVEGLAIARGRARVRARRRALGRGTVQCAARPDPGARAGDRAAPARRAGRAPDVEAELVTPTGAALLTTLVARLVEPPRLPLDASAPAPAAAISKEQPNVLRVLIGEPRTPGAAAPRWPCSRPRSTTRTRSSWPR